MAVERLGIVGAVVAEQLAARVPVTVAGQQLWLEVVTEFVAQVSDSEVKLTRNADGIVVLTGGASRVNDAFELLASKHGRRLLISGVNAAMSGSVRKPTRLRV